MRLSNISDSLIRLTNKIDKLRIRLLKLSVISAFIFETRVIFNTFEMVLKTLAIGIKFQIWYSNIFQMIPF